MRFLFIFVFGFSVQTFASTQIPSFKCIGATDQPGIFQQFEYSQYRPDYIRKFLIDKVLHRQQIVDEYQIQNRTSDLNTLVLKGVRTKTNAGQGSRIEFELRVAKNSQKTSELIEKLYFIDQGEGVWSEPNLHTLDCKLR